ALRVDRADVDARLSRALRLSTLRLGTTGPRGTLRAGLPRPRRVRHAGRLRPDAALVGTAAHAPTAPRPPGHGRPSGGTRVLHLGLLRDGAHRPAALPPRRLRRGERRARGDRLPDVARTRRANPHRPPPAWRPPLPRHDPLALRGRGGGGTQRGRTTRRRARTAVRLLPRTGSAAVVGRTMPGGPSPRTSRRPVGD